MTILILDRSDLWFSNIFIPVQYTKTPTKAGISSCRIFQVFLIERKDSKIIGSNSKITSFSLCYKTDFGHSISDQLFTILFFHQLIKGDIGIIGLYVIFEVKIIEFYI